MTEYCNQCEINHKNTFFENGIYKGSMNGINICNLCCSKYIVVEEKHEVKLLDKTTGLTISHFQEYMYLGTQGLICVDKVDPEEIPEEFNKEYSKASPELKCE